MNQKSPNTNRKFCPLCTSENAARFHNDKRREYLLCPTCHLIFVPPEHHLSAEDEKAQYDLHENSPEDPAYRQFLGRLLRPMQERIAPKSQGLDFGSGPGPTLSVMFEEIGHSMSIYDHFYAQDLSVLDKPYDFITATEVVEHLHYPGKELDRLWACLKPGGHLGIMTKLALGHEIY